MLGEAVYATFKPFIQKALAGEYASYEGYVSHEKFGRRYLHIDYIPHRDEHGKVDGFYSVIRNLTELKEAEEKFRTLVETSPQAIILHDANGKIAIVNSEAEHIFGYRRQELIGQPVEILMPARFRHKHVGERQAYMRKPIVRPMGAVSELYAQRKDGSEFPVEISLSPVETAQGVLVSSTIVDITERKRHEEQTRWSTILEERARMARDVHDTLAQGFTGIILNLEAAEETCADLPKEARDRIARARDVARSSLEEARRSVLALSSPLPVDGDLIGAIRELVDRCRLSTKTQVEFSTRGTAVRLARPVAEDLLRIVQQAVDNALKHARASSIHIEIAFNKKEVRLQIKDDGKGFDVRKVRRGVGLIGMRERAKEIGGKFTLNSKPGKGTRVEITVPTFSHAASRGFSMTKKVPLARSKQIRVIIADDHPVVREGLGALVKSQKDMRVVSEAANGRQAVQQFLLHRPDVLLLDLRMPEMNGIEAIQAILKKAPKAKIIVLSTYSGDEDIYQALQAGAKAYLLKDSPRAQLLESIRDVYSGRLSIPSAIGARLAARMQAPKLTKRETDVTEAHGGREEQQGDWCVARGYRGHGESPHRPHPEEAGRRWTHGGHSDGTWSAGLCI